MRLLLATDGSPHAMRAIKLAVRLARELREAEIILVTVGHIPTLAYASIAYMDVTPLEEAIEQAGRRILEEAAEATAGLNVPVTRVYRSGDPSREILQAASDAKADLIILGARGLGQIGGLILGSVSERVLHGAHTPVLVVR